MSQRLRQTDHERALFVGIDEAGYGPNLGPLVVATTAFLAPKSFLEKDWWDQIAPHIGRVDCPGSIVVDDSKKVLSSPAGWNRLVRTVRHFSHLLGINFASPRQFFESVDIAGSANLTQENWFDPDAAMPQPTPISNEMCRQERQAGEFVDALLDSGIQFAGVCFHAVFPRAFNARLAQSDNKSAVEIGVIAELFPVIFQRVAAPPQAVFVCVDRLGGRKNYRSLVEDLAASAFPQTICETPTVSRYSWTSSETKRVTEIEFRVKADATSMPAALASMFAKFVREVSMDQFNNYWQSRVENLKPTAGYPVDAQRFIAQITPAMKELQISMDDVWRRK